VTLNLTTTSFDRANALALAHVCDRARDGFTIQDTGTDTQVLIVEEKDFVVVAFRATTNIRDWLTDLQIAKTDIPGGRAHIGFVHALDSVIAELIGSLSDLGFEKPLFICGHSLGGALGLLFGYLWEVQAEHPTSNIQQPTSNMRLQAVYTYGAPRVGNGTLKRSFNELLFDRTWNVVNAADPVPLVPPLLDGYRDCGGEVFMPSGGGLKINPWIGTELLADCAGLSRNFLAARWDALWMNHDLNRYIEKLEAA
jgi:hypothetical protein